MVFYVVTDGSVFDSTNTYRGENDGVNEGEEWGMEVDLRSQEKEKRTIHWFVGGHQQNVFIQGIPDRVRFAVCYSYLIYAYYYYYYNYIYIRFFLLSIFIFTLS